jgi:flagellin-specific chaperone FliS
MCRKYKNYNTNKCRTKNQSQHTHMIFNETLHTCVYAVALILIYSLPLLPTLHKLKDKYNINCKFTRLKNIQKYMHILLIKVELFMLLNYTKYQEN